jgi:hypothetical protein
MIVLDNSKEFIFNLCKDLVTGIEGRKERERRERETRERERERERRLNFRR